MAKNKFGLNQLGNRTPAWAAWIFRSVFLLVGIAIFVIASEPTIEDATKVRVGVYLKGFEMLIYGLSKMVGVNVKEEEVNNENDKTI